MLLLAANVRFVDEGGKRPNRTTPYSERETVRSATAADRTPVVRGRPFL